MKPTKFLLIALATAFAAGNLRAEEEAKKKNWKNVTEVSAVSANGNTKSSTYAAKDTYNYDWTKTALELIGAALGADNKGETTAEKYMASEKLSYKLTDRNYTYEKGTWDKDRFAGIRNRYDANAGLGRELIKTPKNDLIGELGAGYINEQRVNSKKNDFASGRAYTKYILKVSTTSDFTQEIEYLHNFEDSDDFRVNTLTSITAAIDAHFSLKLSYIWHHVGQPPVGFHRNDTITAMALIASY